MKTQTDNKICGNCGQERNKHKGRYSDWDKIKGFPCQRFNPLVYDYKNSDYNRMEDDTPQKQTENVCKCGHERERHNFDLIGDEDDIGKCYAVIGKEKITPIKIWTGKFKRFHKVFCPCKKFTPQKQDDIFPKEVYGYQSQEISEKHSKEPARVSLDNFPQTKIERLFERAKKDLEEEKDHTYSIYINKNAVKKACEKEGIKPKKLIEKVFREWLIKEGYLK